MCANYQLEISSNNEEIDKILLGYGEKLVRVQVTHLRPYPYIYDVYNVLSVHQVTGIEVLGLKLFPVHLGMNIVYVLSSFFPIFTAKFYL